jgi:hypothetical protein
MSYDPPQHRRRTERRTEHPMVTTCTCTHARTRHRQQYGEPHTGPCRLCDCPKFTSPGEARDTATPNRGGRPAKGPKVQARIPPAVHREIEHLRALYAERTGRLLSESDAIAAVVKHGLASSTNVLLSEIIAAES